MFGEGKHPQRWGHLGSMEWRQQTDDMGQIFGRYMNLLYIVKYFFQFTYLFFVEIFYLRWSRLRSCCVRELFDDQLRQMDEQGTNRCQEGSGCRWARRDLQRVSSQIPYEGPVERHDEQVPGSWVQRKIEEELVQSEHQWRVPGLQGRISILWGQHPGFGKYKSKFSISNVNYGSIIWFLSCRVGD